MWNLYNLFQMSGERPSQTLRLTELCAEKYGDAGFGWWAGYQFDNAVLHFGRYVENRLMEMDQQGKPRYTLAQLLNPPPKREQARQHLSLLAGMKGVAVRGLK